MNNQHPLGGDQPAQTNTTNQPPIYKNEDGSFAIDHEAEAIVVARQPLIERLLSPESIQRLMLVGGGLLVAGFLVWLRVWTVFKEPLVVAAAIGLLIAAIIGSGIALVRFTRYKMAGTGLAFLGALAMPLQLWFYDAQGLIPLDEGGHLWIPAALFCAVYAAIAQVTRNPLFAFTLVGGIVMTGMLFLADQSVNQFWNIVPQVTFLAAVGWISIFSSLLFAKEESNGSQPNALSPFSRQRYGKSLIVAGLVTLTIGLGMLLVGQIGSLTGILNIPWMLWQVDRTDKLWTLAVVVGSTVGFVGMHVMQGYQRRYLLVAGLMLVWSALTLVNLLNIVLTGGLAAILLSVVIIGVNLATLLPMANNKLATESTSLNDHVLSDLTFIGSLLISCLALFQFIDLHLIEIPFVPQMSPLWMTIQYCLTTVAAATTCFLRISIVKKITPPASFMAITSGFVAALALWNALVLLAVTPWMMVLIGLLVPMALLATAALSKVPMLKQPFLCGASAMTGVHLVCVSGALLLGFSEIQLTMIGSSSPLWMLTMIMAAVNFFLAGFNRLVSESDGATVSFNLFLSAGCSSAAAGIGLSMIGFSNELAIVMAPVVVGLGMMIAKALFGIPLGNHGRCLIAGGNVMMILFALDQVFTMFHEWVLVSAALIHLVAAVIVAVNSKNGWRTLFTLLSVLLTITAGLLINDLLNFDAYLKGELLAVVYGLGCLGFGLRGWALESDSTVERKSSVSASLSIGSLLVMIPTMAMLFHYRCSTVDVSSLLLYGHEMATIVIAMLLCGVGVMCQLRSATLVGGAGVGIYLLSLLTMIQFPVMLQNAAVLMMIGGGLFFGVGLLLSVYRDYVISIPSRAKEGKGLFQIFKWR